MKTQNTLYTLLNVKKVVDALYLVLSDGTYKSDKESITKKIIPLVGPVILGERFMLYVISATVATGAVKKTGYRRDSVYEWVANMAPTDTFYKNVHRLMLEVYRTRNQALKEKRHKTHGASESEAIREDISLSSFAVESLLAELRRRGYSGTLEKKTTINI